MLDVPPFRDPALPIEVRVRDLVGRMTLDEKVSQMMHTARAVPRLGIPAYNYWSEALHGVARNGRATVFPQIIGLAKSPNVHPVLSLPTLAQYSNDLTTYVNLVLLGRMSPDAARTALQARQQKALDKASARWDRVKEKRLAEWRAEL